MADRFALRENFSRKSNRLKEKSTVSFTHKQNIILFAAKHCWMALHMSRPLFAGHVVGSRPMKRKKNLLRMMIIIINQLIQSYGRFPQNQKKQPHFIWQWLGELRGCLHKKVPTGVRMTEILYRVYMMMGHFINLSYLKIHLVLVKYMCDSKLQSFRMHYPFQSTCRLISHQNGWLFCI